MDELHDERIGSTFAVVEFLQSKTVEVVPSHWLTVVSGETKAYFPPKSKPRNRLIQALAEKDINWPLYSVDVKKTYSE